MFPQCCGRFSVEHLLRHPSPDRVVTTYRRCRGSQEGVRAVDGGARLQYMALCVELFSKAERQGRRGAVAQIKSGHLFCVCGALPKPSNFL